MNPEYFMREALKEAEKAFSMGEVPVGAVLVRNNAIIARGHNLKETTKNPIKHAEIIVIERAAQVIGDWRLSGCELYVTLEPCIMCCGAIIQARLDKLFFGAVDPKAGAVMSLYRILDDDRLNHKVEYAYGILEAECSDIIKKFFQKLR